MEYGFIKTGAFSPKIKVADCEHNAAVIIEGMRSAQAQNVKMLVLPELCITGYTCGDLFLQNTLLEGALEPAETCLSLQGCPLRLWASFTTARPLFLTVGCWG